MAALIVLLLFAAGLYLANKIATRHDVHLLNRVAGRKADPIVALEPVEDQHWSMAWTAVDDCQFRRLVDGRSPEHDGS